MNRMAIIRKAQAKKQDQKITSTSRYGDSRIFIYCWWKCEMVQLWKTGWQLYKKKTLLKQNYHMILQCSWGYYPQEN